MITLLTSTVSLTAGQSRQEGIGTHAMPSASCHIIAVNAYRMVVTTKWLRGIKNGNT